VLAVVALRVLAGLGEALFYLLAASAVCAVVPEERHARAQSRFSAVVAGGILLGPIVAEVLRPHTGFAAIWLLGGGLCAVACACVAGLPLQREPPAAGSRTVVSHAAILPGVVVAAQTWAMASFTVFVALYAAHLGVVLDRLGFAGLYGVAAGVSALALVPLALAWTAERAAALADV
jgi:MFS family permease